MAVLLRGALAILQLVRRRVQQALPLPLFPRHKLALVVANVEVMVRQPSV